MKRYLAALLALVLLLTSLAAIASAAPEAGGHHVWEDDGKVYYVKPDGSRVKGWYEYTMPEEYGSDSWWIYGKDDGYLATGWYQVGGVWYYFSTYWGDMYTGSVYVYKDKTAYLLGNDGAYTGIYATKGGWLQEGQDWYYVFEEPDYYYDENGNYVQDGVYLYFASSGIYNIKDTVYAFSGGKMLTKGWQQPYKSVSWAANDEYYQNYWVYVEESGALATGWKKIDGTWYHFSNYGKMARDTMFWDWNDDGTKFYGAYAFDASGAMLMNRWYEDKWEWTDEETGKTNKGSTWYYLGADGAAKTGWFEVGGKWYYAGEYGHMYADEWIKDSAGNWYYLTESGEMAIGWYKYSNGEWLYFKDSGAKVESDWVKDGNSWYYMDENGNMVRNTTLTIKGVEYKFGADGAWIP